MFKLALDTYMVGLIEEVRTMRPYDTPSMIVADALVRYLDFLDSRKESMADLPDDLGMRSDLLELLCSEFDESDC